MLWNCGVGEDSWESLGLQGDLKGNLSWIFTGRTDVEAETPVLWPPDVKNWLIWKDPDAGKDWRQEEKGMTEDEMIAWHHQLDGHEFEQAPGVGNGQESLACCNLWGHKESDVTEPLNWTVLKESAQTVNRWRLKTKPPNLFQEEGVELAKDWSMWFSKKEY